MCNADYGLRKYCLLVDTSVQQKSASLALTRILIAACRNGGGGGRCEVSILIGCARLTRLIRVSKR